MPPKKKEPKERFETILEKLEQTVETLETGDLPLEESLDAFKEGVGFIKEATKRLDEMESKVALLLDEIDEKRSESFDIDEADEE